MMPNSMKRFLIILLSSISTINMHADITAGKTYRIVLEQNAGKTLFVKNASLDEKAPVVLWTDTDVPAQQWTVLDAGNGEVCFRNVYTGMYLDASSMSLAQRTSPSAWSLVPVDGQDNVYHLKQQKRFLRVAATLDGAQPTVGSSAQNWLFIEVEPRESFDEMARRRMIDGFLNQYVQFKGQSYRTFMNGGWGEAETMEWTREEMEALYVNMQKKAMTDKEFRREILEDANSALEKLAGKELPKGVKVKADEDEAEDEDARQLYIELDVFITFLREIQHLGDYRSRHIIIDLTHQMDHPVFKIL